MWIDGELDLGATDLTGWVGDGTGTPATDGVLVNAIDMGAGPFGDTQLYLVGRMTVALTNATGLWMTLVSRDTAPDLVPANWTQHSRTPRRALADCQIGDWFEPIMVPANAGRYISVLFDVDDGSTANAGTVQAYLTRKIDLPLASPQIIPSP